MSLIKSMIFNDFVEDFNTKESFIKLQNGDVSQRDKIIKQWLGLAFHIAKTFECHDNCGVDDYFSVGMEALINAVDNFDLSKGIEFSTYATTCIKREIIKFVNDSRKNTFSSLDVPFYDNEEDSGKIIDYLPDENVGFEFDKVETKMEYECLLSVMKQVLTEKEVEIIKYRFGLVDSVCWTHRDISKKFNLTGINTIIERAIYKVQEKMFPRKVNNQNVPAVCQSHIKQKMQLVHLMKDEMDKLLTENEKNVLTVRFGVLDGRLKKHSEVNQILGISIVQLSTIEKKALMKLQIAQTKSQSCLSNI